MKEHTYSTLLPLIKEFAYFIGFGMFFVSFLVGLMLIVRPDIIVRLNQGVGKKFSLRRSTKILEIPTNIDRLFYRHHRIIGAGVTLLAGYVLYYFSFGYNAVAVSEILKTYNHGDIIDMVISSLRLFMQVCCAVILLLGVAIFYRPSQLKKVEAWANRWISTRKATRPLSLDRDQMNQLVYKYPRFSGLLIAILSIYASVLLFLVYTR
jgi:hypothetical protein